MMSREIQAIASNTAQVPPTVRLLGTLVKAVVAAIVISLALASVLLVHIGHAQDETVAEASERQYSGLIRLLSRQLGSHVRDYTHWDESVERLAASYDAEWWDKNAGAFAVDSFGLSFSLAVDGSDRPRLATTPSGRRTDLPVELLTPSLRTLLAEARLRPASATGAEAVATGIVEFEGGLHLAGAVLFLPESEEVTNPDPQALLIYARSLPDDIFVEVAGIMGSPDLRRLDAAPGRGTFVPLVLADGSSAGVVAWTPPSPGRSMTADVLPLVSAAFLFVAALVAFFAYRARRLALALHADERARQELAARNQSILDTVGEGIFGIDQHGMTVFVNPAALAAIGYEVGEFVGRDPHPLICCKLPDCSRNSVEDCPVRQVLADGQARSAADEVFVRKDGSSFPVEFVVTPVKQDAHVTGAVVVFRDITGRRQTEEEIRYRANYDALTGLPNRNLLVERLSQELKLSRRENATVGLLFLDLDHFKEVNDTLGHEAGDLLLRQAATRMHDSIRETDTVGRLGGDEFVILLPHLNDAGAAALIADKVIAALGTRFDLDGHDAWVGASIGIVVFPGDGEDASELLRNADLAMYKAKEAGRNTYRFYKSSMTEYVLARRGLEMDLRRAVENGEFVLHYQPIVDLRDRRTVHLEALVRWRHPQRGLLTPGDFIPLAEETGLIAEIGEWVLHESCRQLAQWRAMGKTIDVAINVSGRQVPRDLPPEMIASALAAHGLPSSALMIEITETVLFNDSPPVRGWLNAVRELGIRLLIDDFGTGYSSLSYLKHFSLEALKIDKSFIDGLLDNKADQALVRAILAMAKGLGLPVVAEGVETEAQMEWLYAHGCEYAQGYLFARPVEAAELDIPVSR
jgi:diguanylate cyclase (GGDEF)-like protein/PAS domain S-box-containing protein